MRPKPKKRRKKKEKKLKSNDQSQLITVGGYLVQFNSSSNKIDIRVDKNFNNNWALKIILFGIAFAIGLLWIIKSEIDGFVITIVTIPLVLFAFLGLSYWHKTKSNELLTFDINKGLFYYHKTKSIPFHLIQSFEIGSLKDAIGVHRSYHLNMKFKNGKTEVLFTSDQKAKILEVQALLVVKTGVGTELEVPYSIKD